MHLGLNVNRFCFQNCYEPPSIFGSYFKFWCVSYHSFAAEEHSRRTAESFLEIGRISEYVDLFGR
jgi:hypothetical protein